MRTTTVISTRIDEETLKKLIGIIGSNKCVGDVLRELVIDFVRVKGEGAGQKLISEKEQPSEKAYSQEQAEGAKEKGHGFTALEVPEEETPLDHGVNSEAVYKEPGDAFQTATSKPTSLQALNLDPGEASQSQACPFYRFDSERRLVECDKDFLTKGRRAYVITQETCDWCWEKIMRQRQQAQDLEGPGRP